MRLHKYCGLALGIIFFILCFTGGMIAIGKLVESDASIYVIMKKLHGSLMLGKFGKFIVGATTLIIVIEIITGYCLWGRIVKTQVRRNKSILKGILKGMQWNYPTKAMGLHNLAGVLGGVPLLIMVFTGLTWSFDWANQLAMMLFNNLGGDLSGTIAKLHVGSWSRDISRVIWILAVALGASLPISGLIAYKGYKKQI